MRLIVAAMIACLATACTDEPEDVPDAALAPRCRPAMQHSYWSGCSTETSTTYAQSLSLADAVALCESNEVATSSCRGELESWIVCNETTELPDHCSCAGVYSALSDCLH